MPQRRLTQPSTPRVSISGWRMFILHWNKWLVQTKRTLLKRNLAEASQKNVRKRPIENNIDSLFHLFHANIEDETDALKRVKAKEQEQEHNNNNNKTWESGTVLDTFNPNTLGEWARGSWVQAQTRQRSKILSQIKILKKGWECSSIWRFWVWPPILQNKRKQQNSNNKNLSGNEFKATKFSYS